MRREEHRLELSRVTTRLRDSIFATADKIRAAARKMRVVFSLWPQIRELQLLLQNIINQAPLDQPSMIQCRRAFHAIVDFAGRFSHQRESAALDLEHVLEPG